MIKLNEAVIVEGKYDKIRLESVIDALIITTEGFGVFKNREKQKLIRALAKRRGLIIMTDSDGAGFMIRNFISGCVAPELIKHVYIPDIFGKEKRKAAASCEGKLGVEGMDTQALIEAFARAGICHSENSEKREEITRAMLYNDRITGGENSSKRRGKLIKLLSLPEHMSTNALLGIINSIITADEYRELVKKLKN